MEGSNFSRKMTYMKSGKRVSPLKRMMLSLLAVVTVLGGGIFWVSAEDTYTGERKYLQKVGPVSEVHGFPLWYKDSNDLRLELCIDETDPLCDVPVNEMPNPTGPVSFPDNFPAEAFYMLAGAELETATGDRATAGFQLEAAFAQEVAKPGDQIVFGRVRFRVDGLQPDATYKITHPYGEDTFVAEVADEDEPTIGEINFTEDIGIDEGFEGALKSRIGTFLRWDPEYTDNPGEPDTALPNLPAGYVGDPAVNNRVVGGLNNQNFVRITGPGIGESNRTISPNRCTVAEATDAGTVPANCIIVYDFSLMGKEATNIGGDVARATYSRTAAGEGNIDVFAWTDDGQPKQVMEAKKEVAGETPVTMMGDKGRYFARIPFTGEIPEVTVTNVSDNPTTVDSNKTVTPVDLITATAIYDGTNLTVTASSSDQMASPTFTVSEYETAAFTAGTDAATALKNATAVIPIQDFLPPNITIKSNVNGSVKVPVIVTGSPAASTGDPVANAGEAQTVAPGAEVTLTGTNTGGEATIRWDQVANGAPTVVLTGGDTLTPTFTAPAEGGVFVFKLTLKGTNGVSSTSEVTVTVSATGGTNPEPVPAPTANAGADQSVKQNTTVTLDGSGSANTVKHTWKQTAGTPVTLSATDVANPTFTAPKKAENLTFELTAEGGDGTTVTDTVTITTVVDTLNTSKVNYDRRKRSWDIQGASDVFGPGVKVKIYIGTPIPANLLTEVDVDSTGAFRFHGSGRAAISGANLTFVSSSGGKLEKVSVAVD